MKFAYFDTWPQPGAFTEVPQNGEMLDELFKMIADAAVGWDAKDPIRYL